MSQFDLTMYAMKNAAQMGSINRFCATILTISGVDELIPMMTSLLEEFNISGGYHLSLENSKISKCFGVKEASKNALLKTRNMGNKLKKITKENDLIIIKQSKYTLVVSIDGMSDGDVDLLMDNLAIFCDVVQSWAEHFEKNLHFRSKTDRQKISTINNLENLKECLSCSSFQLQECNEKLNSDIISRLAMLFPVLGLDANQENRILELFEKCTDEFGKFVSRQVIFNGEISELLVNASVHLKTDDNSVEKTHQKN